MKRAGPRFLGSLCASGAIAYALITAGEAAALAQYNFASATASIDADPNSTATNFTSTYGSQSGHSTSSQNYFVRVQSTPAVATTTTYFSFTVNAVSGATLNLTDLTFRTAVVDNSTTAYIGTVFVRSSVDGFASDLGSYTQDSTSGSTFTSRSIDLSGAAFQDLSSVTFRFYHYDDSDSTTTNAIVHRIDDVILNGSAIPEPASFALLGLGGLSLLARRRR